MSKYYTSDWLQTKSIGIFISVVVHLLLLGIILPRLSGGDDSFLKGKRRIRNINLVSLTPLQQQNLPEAFSPPTPSEPETEPIPDTSPTISTDQLSPPPSSDLETIPVPPPLEEVPPPPPVAIEPSPSLGRPSLLPLPSPPIPPELIEIINPRDDWFSSPKLTEPEVIPEPEPVIAAEPEPIPAQREDNLIASVQAKARLLKYDKSNTTPQEAEANYQTWIAWQEHDNPQEMAWQGNYPLDGCIKKIEGTTTYGVLVNPDGQVINLHLIQSAGYPLLNEKASQQIDAYNFGISTDIKAYLVTIKFTYDDNVCPSLSVSP